MRAIVTDDYGSAPRLAEVPTPTAGPGQVRVAIRHASLNGLDNAVSRGYLRGMMDHIFPVVLGKDYAGTVDQVGDGVTEFALGDEVFGVVLSWPLREGSFAEYAVLAEQPYVARTPAGLDPATAGVIGLAGSAAMGCLDAVQPGAGDTMLVSGATGGVGAFVMQVAAARGATVIATATPGPEADHVRGLGATYVVDYTGDVPGQVRALAPGGVDIALHMAGDPQALADLLVHGGRFASLLGVGPEQLGDRPITATSVIAQPERPLLERLAADVAAGRLRIPVQRSYAFDDVPKAFDDFAAGTLGKLAVTIA
jgi:NADPH:quinone reductase-like Zn-dependent oxidoreductase